MCKNVQTWAFGHWLSISAILVVLRWRHCFDQTWAEVCDQLCLVSRWRIVKSNKRFVNYLSKNDGMIVRIPVHLSCLLLAPTSKFYFANMLITPYNLRNVENWAHHKLKTIFWLRLHFRVAMPSCFWSRIWRQKHVSVRVRQNTPLISVLTCTIITSYLQC